MMKGKRTRFLFAKKSAAETKAQQLRVQRANERTSAFSLQATDRIDAEAALALLKPLGRTVREASEFFVKNFSAIEKEIEVGALVKELITNKTKDGASARYLKDLRTRLNIFASAFPQRKAVEFSTAEIDDWLRALPSTAVTRNNYRRILGVLFNCAVNRGYALSNPIKATSKAKEVHKPPGILSVEQAARLLEASTREMLPAIALGLFAGLRPESEIWLLDWSHIDLEHRLIDVAADRTKTAQKRWVKIADNLAIWLLPHRRRSGPVSPRGDDYFTRLQKIREAAGITYWPSDCLRHTFGSMHYAHHQNLGEAMAEMGHTNPQTFLTHYRERVRPKDAARYWTIAPSEPARKVVRFR